MQLPRPVGREAASRKYDILSALTAFALSKDKHVQRQVMRIMALITTRYNWQRDELTIAITELETELREGQATLAAFRAAAE